MNHCVATRHSRLLQMSNVYFQHWRKKSYSVGEPSPTPTDIHIAVCLHYGEEHPQLFVFGGRGDVLNLALKDGWILDVQSWKWSEVSEVS